MSRADGGGDVSHTFIDSARRLFSLGLVRLGGRPRLRRLRSPSREHPGFRQAAPDSGLRRHRCVRRTLHHPAKRLYFFACPDQGRQSRLRLLKPDHRGSRAQRCRSRAIGRRARACRIGAGRSRGQRASSSCERRHRQPCVRATHFGFAGRFYAGDDIAPGRKACRFHWTSIPDAAHARSDRGGRTLFFLNASRTGSFV